MKTVMKRWRVNLFIYAAAQCSVWWAGWTGWVGSGEVEDTTYCLIFTASAFMRSPIWQCLAAKAIVNSTRVGLSLIVWQVSSSIET
jgi:hypothetical protein